MTIIDANYILRWFLGDVPAQAAISTELLNDSEAESLYIDRATLAEVTYVLRGKGYDHGQVVQALTQLYAYPSMAEAPGVELCALQIFGETTFDFEDCLMAAWCETAGYRVASFDKDLQKYLAR